MVEGEFTDSAEFYLNNHAQIENLDGTDPRFIGIRGLIWEVLGARLPLYRRCGLLTVCDPSNSEGRARYSLLVIMITSYTLMSALHICESIIIRLVKTSVVGGLDSPTRSIMHTWVTFLQEDSC